MPSRKVKAVIVNRSRHELIMRVGNNGYFYPLATIADGAEHKLELDLHWAYQEFSLEPSDADHGMEKVFLNSDEVCDYERMTVTISQGKMQLEKTAQVRLKCKAEDFDRQSVPSGSSYFTWLPTWPNFRCNF